MTSSAAPFGVLAYASPDVRSSPPRTLFRLIFAFMGRCFALMLAGIRACLIGLGYTLLAVGISLRFVFAIVAMILLYAGGIRWHVVKRRTLTAARWVDVKVLTATGFFRRHLLPCSTSGVAR